MSGTSLETPVAPAAPATPATPATPAAPATLLAPTPAAPAVVTDPNAPPARVEVKTVEAPKAPEKYDFKFPEGVTPNQPLIEGFTELAKASNLTQEQADKYVALYTKHQAEEKAALALAVKQQRDAWIKEAETDKYLGGAKYDDSLVEGRKGIKWANDPALESLLLDSGFDAHPAVLRFFVKVARTIGEDSGGGKNVPGGEKSETDRLRELYPNSPELFGDKKD